VDLGSLYLDIIKDRIYTLQENSIPRRSAQTTLYYVVESLVRWLAPILSFTAEEIWRHMPGRREDSVFLTTWYELPPAFGAQGGFLESDGDAFWGRVIAIREQVNKILEKLRDEGRIGSSLDAEVDIYADADTAEQLHALQDELRFVLITSYATVHAAEDRPQAAAAAGVPGLSLWIAARACAFPKCVRCWHHREDVGRDAAHPQLCGRCIENVSGAGEVRRHA
jgi:isoleucyl-tRNA synthetase